MLARPKKERGPRPGALDRDDVWDQPGVTEASAYDVPAERVRALGRGATGSRRSSATRTTSSPSSRELRAPGRADDRPLRLGALHRRARRRRHARPSTSSTRSPAPSRSATAGWDWRRPTSTWGCHPELIAIAEHAPARPTAGGDGDVRLSRGVPRPPQAARAGAGGVRGDRRPAAAAAGQGAGRRASRSAPGRGAAAARPADRAAARRPADRRAPARARRAATSASRRRAGRGSGCRCTRRSPSACRRSPTTRRR